MGVYKLGGFLFSLSLGILLTYLFVCLLEHIQSVHTLGHFLFPSISCTPLSAD